jgi:predicted metal-binding membrane protein
MSDGMEMPGGWTMSMMWMCMPGQTWLASAAMFLLMWLTMMIAMMLPSAIPMLNTYRTVPRVGGAPGTLVGSAPGTLLVACGYFAVWTLIGLVLYALCVSWAYATMRSSTLSHLVPTLTGTTLILAGLMQFSRWKMAALTRCRDPLACALSPGGADVSSASGGSALSPGSAGILPAAWHSGLQQGMSCAMCCSGPMLALLALGAMNLAAMAIVTLVISLEKLLPRPLPFVRLSGALAIIIGAAMLLRPLLPS